MTMGKMTKMIPIPSVGVVYILDINERTIWFKFSFYNSSVSFNRCVDIVEVEEGILLPSLGNHIVIPHNKKELLKMFNHETVTNYFN